MNQKPPRATSTGSAKQVRFRTVAELRRVMAVAAFIGAVAMGFPTAEAQNRQRSYWLGPQTGSHIAPGFVKYGSAAPSTVQAANEDPTLAGAINNLESRAGTVIDGRLIIWDIVSQQVQVPVPTLKQQAAETKMTAGELLVANSLAGGSGKKVNEVIALRRKSKSWAEVSKQLRVDPRSVAARARAASESLRAVETRIARGRERSNARLLQGSSLPGPEAGGN
jgi:hypothetical protein